jgi:hypothetical protein
MRAIEAAGIALAAVQSRAIARRIVVPGTFVPHGDRIVGPPFELHQARLINLGASTGIGFTSGFFCLRRCSRVQQSRQDQGNRNTNQHSNRQKA